MILAKRVGTERKERIEINSITPAYTKYVKWFRRPVLKDQYVASKVTFNSHYSDRGRFVTGNVLAIDPCGMLSCSLLYLSESGYLGPYLLFKLLDTVDMS